jgi:hypothetical protein
MAKQTIDIGTSANKGDGDPLRTAFRKINENFTELYAANGDADGAATNVLPSADGIYSLGSADKQWADVFIADFIYLNGTRIEVNSNGALLVGGSNPIQTQDTMGSVFGDDSTLLVDGVNNTIPSANISGTEASNWNTAYLWGDHSAAGYAPQATTYTKVEVDAAIAAVDPFSGDVTGSVFADDSTLLVDGVNGTIPAANLSGALPAIDGSALTGVVSAFSDLTGTPTTLAGYGITDAVTAGGDFEGNLLGSVFADDSTLLVDGVGGTIAGPISSQNWMAAYDGYVTISNGGNTVPGPIQIVASANLDLSAGAGQVINANRNIVAAEGVTGDLTGNVTGDVNGSVFADDSTLLVDGVNSTINSSALTKPIALADNEKMTFGTDDDLEIFHNSSNGNTIIENAGNLVIKGSNLFLQSASSEYFFRGAANGAVTLYYDNVAKFETTADGVAITGKITGLTDPTAAQDAATKAYVDANSGGGGSGLQSRGTVTGTTSSLADAAEADLDITGFKSYALLAITTDRAARVRLYVSDATRTADASRAEGVDPTSDAGLIAEVITTGADTVIISPGAFGFNLESSPTTTIPCRVTNKSGGTSTVQVDLNILQLEA